MSTNNLSKVRPVSRTTVEVNYDSNLRKEIETSSTVTGVVTTLSATRVSSTTPNFHKPGRPRLKPLPFNYTDVESSPTSGYQSYYRKDKITSGSGSQLRRTSTIGEWNTSIDPFVGYDSMNTSRITRMTDIANQKVLSKIKNSSANFAVAYAEMHKTGRMVGDTATKIASALVNLKHGNFRKAAQDLGVPVAKRAASRFKRGYARDAEKAVASGWLSLNYGWKPLLSDVYGACDALARNLQRDLVIRSTSRVKEEVPLYQRSVSGTVPKTTTTLKGVAYYNVKTSVSYVRPGNNSQVTAKETGLINPLEVAWELVPYSFVVDWFLPVGSFLSTLDATVGLTFLDGYTTVYFRSSQKTDEVTAGQDSLAVWDHYRTYSRTRVYCDRKVLGSFPSAGIPRFKNPLSLSHAASAIALLSNLFRK